MANKENLIFAHSEEIRPGEFSIARVTGNRGLNYKFEVVFEGTLTDLADSWLCCSILGYLDAKWEILFLYNPADNDEFDDFLKNIASDEGDEDD